jgi:hypothetical protein
MPRSKIPGSNTPLPLARPTYEQVNETTARRQIELNFNSIQARLVEIEKVVDEQGAAIPVPVGGATVDTEARAAIDAIIGALEAHGLIAS